MAEPVLSRIRASAVAMKLEATYGVDVFGGTVVAADVLNCRTAEVTPQMEPFESGVHGGYPGSFPGIVNVSFAQVVFEMPLRGKGVAYSATVRPEADLPLRGCGLLATLDATLNLEKFTYTPRLTGFESMTIYVMAESGVTYEIVGAFGDAVLTWIAGQPVVARFTFTGLLEAKSAVALVRGTPSATPVWPQFKSAVFRIGTENFAARFQNLAFNLGNTISPVEDENAVGGVAGGFIADRAPNGSFDPEMVPSATFPWWTKLDAGELMSSSWQAGGTQYNRIKPSVAKVQLMSLGHGDRGGKRVFTIGWQMRTVIGGDEYSLVYD